MSFLPIVSSSLGILEKLLDRIIPDPNVREQAKLKLLESESQAILRELELQTQAILAEASTQDPWVARARPTFLYVMYLVIILCILGSIIGVFFPDQVFMASKNLGALLAAIPEHVWDVFIIGYLGYVGARSFDKWAGRNSFRQ